MSVPKRFKILIVVIMFLFSTIFINPLMSVAFHNKDHSEAAIGVPPIGTHAQTSALIDVNSGRILQSHQGDKQMLIASLTKIMTAIVAIEHGNLADQVKVSKNAYAKEGSSLYLKLGEVMNLEHMLYGLMMRSGNDAATAIAEHVGGSLEGFAYLMNEKAQSIGMTNSHFVNPHGLNADNHYSTANDMAKLTAYALKNPVFKTIVKTKLKKVPNPNEKWDYTWYNKNKMLSLFESGDGVKTGYTKAAGRCLVSSATRGGQQLAVVTLNDSNDWADHASWLTYGFQHFPLHQIIEKGTPIEEGQGLVAGQSFNYPMTDEELTLLQMKMELITDIHSVQYKLGERGALQYWIQNTQIGSIPIYEVNSTRLQLKNQSRFIFNQSQSGVTVRENQTGRYFSILNKVIHALFTHK